MRQFSFLLCGLILLITSCNQSTQSMTPGPGSGPDTPLPSETLSPNLSTPFPVRPSPSPTSMDSGWVPLQAGMESRTINLSNENSVLIETLYVLRIDPHLYSFKVAYDPIAPRNLSEWAAQTGAQVMVNGGYFSREEEHIFANGLLVIDGQAMGYSYGPFAGMLAVTHQGPELRWLAQQPYDPDEPLLSALQSFPLLVKPGGEQGFPAENEDNLTARRTVIAQDTHGRMLLIVAPMGHFTLHKLSQFLAGSDLELDIAMNLDGGPSSGIFVASTSTAPLFEIPAYSPLPIVITVHNR